ncbi:hypothetical protein cu0342 [Corynebacterium urealyticum DSM 7109]|uniref:Uncharacterized protein n=1 Tax=Corynebacterium urealyticum (strain ATCC 43042 / DSM 7109) TaxID=504474 RepID=B1VEW3_CORU7|nr:hypothetical protein cu0342 [Corynebacterium urealyticum DSM 7109]
MLFYHLSLILCCVRAGRGRKFFARVRDGTGEPGKHEDSAPDRPQTSLTQSVLNIRGREGFFVKKTIIALAAASSVALSHGVAVAEEPIKDDKVTAAEQNTNGSSELKDKLAGSSEKGKEEDKGQETEGGDVTEPENEDEKEPKGSSAQDFFGWKDDASGLEKLIKIGSAVAAVVALLGSISALIANIEKIVKQFTKVGK